MTTQKNVYAMAFLWRFVIKTRIRLAAWQKRKENKGSSKEGTVLGLSEQPQSICRSASYCGTSLFRMFDVPFLL
jgi:hypothetical protein